LNPNDSNNKLSVLLIDDDEDDLFLTGDCLAEIDSLELDIDKESNYRKAHQKILENRHDVYLIDYLMGPHTGIELIRECVKAGINKPFILLTGKGDLKIDIEAANAGAYDYLTKSELTAELLERSLRYSIQRYSAFKAIAESENRYREIFMKSNDIIFVLDGRFRLVNFNPMMNTLMGYTSDELYNQPLAKLFENPAEAKTFISRIQADDIKNDTEIVLLTKSAIRKTFLASCSKTTTPDGTGQYQVILYDYTSIKKSVAEQLLKEKIETTERLVRSLAHEIRNPLTAINLSLHQLEHEVNEDSRLLTDIIKRNSNRINDVIGDLMNISNPVNKKEEVIDSEVLIRSVLALATDRLELKRIKLFENYLPEKTYVIGDLKKLQIALLNIIINAIEAMEYGKGKLMVETSVADNDDMVAIKIKDNGSGIPSQNLSHLFQPYFTDKKNGMGLGLATAHSFIHAHNGSIEVSSETGKGATFIVKLQAATPSNAIPGEARKLKLSDKV
jgi:PAS domain S-box-containing protein